MVRSWIHSAGAQRVAINPGFAFCLPRMVPLYTRGPPSPRDFLRRTLVQLRRPSRQPALTCVRMWHRAWGQLQPSARFQTRCSSAHGQQLILRVKRPAAVRPVAVQGQVERQAVGQELNAALNSNGPGSGPAAPGPCQQFAPRHRSPTPNGRKRSVCGATGRSSSAGLHQRGSLGQGASITHAISIA